MAKWWHVPRSIRARVTAGTVGTAALVLLVTLSGTSLLARELVEQEAVDQAAEAARRTVTVVHQGRVNGALPAENGVVRLQVVDHQGRVVAASAALRGAGPLTNLHPSGNDTRVEGVTCPDADDMPRCLTVVGFHTDDSAYGDVMVYAAVVRPLILSHLMPEVLLGALGVAMLAVAGWLTWWGVGRTLRPVERIRAELERLSASDPGARLTVPDTGDEVAELARTGNDTLDRLQSALDRQRSFVSDASHELRNPIAGLRTRLEVELAAPDGGDPRTALRGALSDVERLQRIVSDLLELARLEADIASGRELVDLGEVALEEAARRTPEQRVETEVAPDVLVRGSRLRLARLLTNLLANAERHARTLIRVVVAVDGDDALLRVHDDGRGIAPEDRERIFERFARLDESRRRAPDGSGLGLAISREVAVAHGGGLEAGESPQLGGAMLTLRIPLARPTTEEPPAT